MRQYFLVITEKNREIKRNECVELFENKESDMKSVVKGLSQGYENRSNFVVSIKEGARFDKGVLNAIRVLYNTMEANRSDLKEKDVKKADKVVEMADIKLEKVIFGFSSEYDQLAFMSEQQNLMNDNLRKTEEFMKYLEDTETEVYANGYEMNGVNTSGKESMNKAYKTMVNSFEAALGMYKEFFESFSKELKDNFIKKSKAETEVFKEYFAKDFVADAKEGIEWK